MTAATAPLVEIVGHLVDELSDTLSPDRPWHVGVGGGLGTRVPDQALARLTELDPSPQVELWTLFAGLEFGELLQSGRVAGLNTSYLDPATKTARDDRGEPLAFTRREWPEWLFLLLFQAKALGLAAIPYPASAAPSEQSISTFWLHDRHLAVVPTPSLDCAFIRVEEVDEMGNANLCKDAFLAELDIAMAAASTRTVLIADRLATARLANPQIAGVHVDWFAGGIGDVLT